MMGEDEQKKGRNHRVHGIGGDEYVTKNRQKRKGRRDRLR